MMTGGEYSSVKLKGQGVCGELLSVLCAPHSQSQVGGNQEGYLVLGSRTWSTTRV